MLAFAACKTAHVSSDYDHGTQFSSFHTFTMVSRPHPSAQNPLAVQRTTDAIREELTRKGFVYVEDATQADFAVDFSIGAQDRLDVSSTPAAGWAGPWFSGRFSGNEVNVRQYQEGTLSIDVFDMHSRKAVWRGSGKKELSQSEVEKTSTVIREAVTSVLADFPPKAT
ncbi:MAG TPA: DUF4136 domain-containing protein [Myxococcales bacterium]|nr:DUF4136 domain-containing protein [Myxococcales bacterium]